MIRFFLGVVIVFQFIAGPLVGQSYKLLPVYNKAEYDAGVPPGDNQQYMTAFAYSEADPDRIYSAHDVGGAWVSLDAGKSWNTLTNYGLGSRFLIGLQVDPIDRNRLVAIAQGGSSSAKEKGEGIYFSADGGLNWKKAFDREEVSKIRVSARIIDYAPSSKNAKLKYATRWYAVLGEDRSASNRPGDDGFFMSNDGGQTWTEVRKLPADQFPLLPLGIRVHPFKPDVVYMYGSEGLFRFEEATNPNGAVTKLSGSNGIPEGSIYGDIYISPDAKRIIVAVAGKGIYQSVNSGASWNELYAWKDIQKCFVNEKYPDRIYATATRASGQQLRVSKDGGASWNTEVASTPVPGYTRSWNTHIFGGFAWVIPDPRNPDAAFAQGNAKYHRTSDGGDRWTPSNGYFNGNQFTGINMEQMFDPANADRFFYFMVDVGPFYTDNKGKWFVKSDVDQRAMGLTHRTCNAGAVHPDGSTGIVLMSIQKQQGHLLRSTNNGQTWSNVRPTSKPRWFIAFDQQDPDYCYQWRERSADAGATWTEMTAMPEGTILAGMSYTDGRVLYALEPRAPYRIFRSDDRGESWREVIRSTVKLTSPVDNTFTFRVHPRDHNIVFTTGPDGNLMRWDLSRPVEDQQTVLKVAGDIAEDGFYICRLAIDRRNPDVMYAANMKAFSKNMLFRSRDGGATWENISADIPSARIGGLEVSPVTGEVFISGPHGTRILPPPYPSGNGSYDAAGFQNAHITKPY